MKIQQKNNENGMKASKITGLNAIKIKNNPKSIGTVRKQQEC